MSVVSAPSRCDVVAEHDVERPVRVRGEATGPGRAAGEVRRAVDRLERLGVDLLDPRGRVGTDRVAQQVDLARIAEHDHRGRRHVARDDLEPVAGSRGRAPVPARGRWVRRGPPSSPGQRLGQ